MPNYADAELCRTMVVDNRRVDNRRHPLFPILDDTVTIACRVRKRKKGGDWQRQQVARMERSETREAFPRILLRFIRGMLAGSSLNALTIGEFGVEFGVRVRIPKQFLL